LGKNDPKHENATFWRSISSNVYAFRDTFPSIFLCVFCVFRCFGSNSSNVYAFRDTFLSIVLCVFWCFIVFWEVKSLLKRGVRRSLYILTYKTSSFSTLIYGVLHRAFGGGVRIIDFRPFGARFPTFSNFWGWGDRKMKFPTFRAPKRRNLGGVFFGVSYIFKNVKFSKSTLENEKTPLVKKTRESIEFFLTFFYKIYRNFH